MIFLDTETFNEKPIKHGTYAYTSTCELMVVTYALNDEPIEVWDRTAQPKIPEYLGYLLLDTDELITAHAAMFDRNVLKYALKMDIPIPRWRCSMVRALAHALPGGLDSLCEILDVDQDLRKLKSGRQLMQLFCMPRPVKSVLRRATRMTHSAEWAEFLKYATNDISSMRALDKKLPRWNYEGEELALWHLDQKINDRGFLVDTDLATAAVRAVECAKARLVDRTMALTNQEVESTTKRDQLLAHILREYGVDLPDVQKATLERRIADPELPAELRELLIVRLQASSTSTSKYQSLLNGTMPDGRLRGTLQFAGASRTRRWAGRTFQPQNLPSKGLPSADEVDLGIAAMKGGFENEVFSNVMSAASFAVRGCIIAPPGKKLVISDLANIEGRDAAWLAGEEWKLQAFRDFDAGLGPDLYKLAYARSFKISPDGVLPKQRQIGKVEELMLQYQGRVGAWVTGALTYDIDLEALALVVFPTLPDAVKRRAIDFLTWTRSMNMPTFGLTDGAFITCDGLTQLWRAFQPATSSFWPELKDTAIRAINEPGNTFICRRLKVRRDGAWLRIGLPSGRALCYPSPRIVHSKKIEGDPEGREENIQAAITYMGNNQYTRQWERLYTYGGKLFENCIAGGTPVLTTRGWVDIQNIRSGDVVWDGEDWVSQGGCIYRGNMAVLSAYGVTMTPDHKVLTTEGWQNASSCERHNRVYCRLPNGFEVPGIRREEVVVGGGLPLWEDRDFGGNRAGEAKEKGDRGLVRLYAASVDWLEKHLTRDVRPPSVLGMAFYERSLQPSYPPGLAQLRRPGYYGLPGLAGGLRKFLARYGVDVPERAHSGAGRQFKRVFSGQLSMGGSQGASKQQAHQPPAGDSIRGDDAFPSRQGLRVEPRDSCVPTRQRMAVASRTRPVYDLINCGPRNRFVVRGADGLLLIVHNCCQSLAGDILKANMFAIEAAGYNIVLSVHDEVVTEAPDSPEFNAKHLSSLLATVPSWAEGMPLAAAGFETYRYRKE